jgi:hypothetical protein
MLKIPRSRVATSSERPAQIMWCDVRQIRSPGIAIDNQPDGMRTEALTPNPCHFSARRERGLPFQYFPPSSDRLIQRVKGPTF